jgi:hypothetical protein
MGPSNLPAVEQVRQQEVGEGYSEMKGRQKGGNGYSETKVLRGGIAAAAAAFCDETPSLSHIQYSNTLTPAPSN